ncbi:MAG: O-antigen ligase family protein, partial [Candidatus Obscuribacterales bacterium]|nr:O-antigen ligase family protein [Candidatus Obscuribacterales bacterium]
EDKTTRVYSTLKNPNLLAGYLIPLIPLSFSMAIYAFCQKGWQRLMSLPMLGVGAVITVCSIMTGSRGGWMGIGAALGILGLVVMMSLWVNKPKLRPLLLVVVFIIPPLLMFGIHHVPKIESRILSIFAGREHSSNSYRMNVYVSSIKMFLDSWWLGVGPGNSTFKLAYGLYMRSGFDALGTYCVPLEVAVETGVVGLGVFIWMIIGTIARAHENFWGNQKGPERWIAAGAAAALLGMMVHGLVDTVYYRPQVQFVFWLLLALCIRNGKDSKALSSSTVVETTNEKQTPSS